ncbi:leu3p [Saccharomyces arboricola H-6]|uniref:Leu3p n=1 Tax=Saccharomyces arboricola (strain H-6 / AS 2.3317 / CBS 10644) TaxID=1160507 RepID=J8Q4Z1_SACAR|nr:leu3p [Saccharomyces arboricola H-6]
MEGRSDSVATSQSGSEMSHSEIKNRTGINARKRKFACVECRQQKSKCDAHERAPEPCTKCAKKNVPCILKRDFRRTYKRARNEAIEKRFKELTRTLTNLSSDEILKKIEEEQEIVLDNSNFTKEKVKQLRKSAFESTDIELRPYRTLRGEPIAYNTNRKHADSSPLALLSSSATFDAVQSINVMSEEQLKCLPKSLGDVYLSSSDIAELFQEFATKYHQFLPVVDLSKGAERIYHLSPCLFWVILLIGLRRKFGATDLMTRLSMLVKSVLSEITISPIIRYTPSDRDEPVLNVASVYSVQAFLLYTFWPPLTSSLSADTSWNTIGTAMFQALRVGLNCAGFSKEYASANSELVNEQIRTWICCNVVSQTVASSFGFPAYVSFDYLVISSTRMPNSKSQVEIPNELRQMAQIARFENQIVNTMNSTPANATGMVSREEKQPLLHVLNQQLSQLEISLEENNLDDIRKFLLLVAKVHLLTYYFTDITPQNEGKFKGSIYEGSYSVMELDTSFETKRGLVKVYNAAVKFLIHANSMWEHNPTIIKYFPGLFVLNIWQSACIISKLIHSSLHSMLDISSGKKAYSNAISLTFNASVLKYDMAYRSSGIMRSIWSLFANMYDAWRNDQKDGGSKLDNDFNLGITIKSRMSVNVFFDCLYILKEKCGMAKLERETKVSTAYNVDEEEEDEEDEGEEEEEEEEDDEEEATLTGTVSENTDNQQLKARKFTNIKHPVKKARRIIETIPLDPNPINAGSTSSGSSLTTPNSQVTNTISYRGILNKMSPREQMNHANLDSGPSTGIKESETINEPLPITTDAEHLAMQPPLPITQKQENDQLAAQTNSSLLEAYPIIQTNPVSSGNKESPNSIMANWDNWESDMVWRDVDILMNEFAFNPKV